MIERITTMTTTKTTLKALRADPRYIKTFMTCGNAKLKDYIDEYGNASRYAMFNLPAKTTCPDSTEGCRRFCYAKRDERYPSVRANRAGNFEASRGEDFADRLIYTIEVELKTKRYAGSKMILRIHESGDFYNPAYLRAWLDVIAHFTAREDEITFCFYTKCFKYLIALNPAYRDMLNYALESGLCAMSLSYDKTMPGGQKADLMLCKIMYPAANIYAAIPGEEVDSFEHDEECDCANCAKCGKCLHATGKTTVCAIH